MDLRGLFELFFDFLKILKSYLESTLNFIISQNSDKNWLDAYLIDLLGFLDLRGLFWVIFWLFENFEIIFGIYIKFYYKSKLWQKLIAYIFNWFIRFFGFKGSFLSYFFTFWKFWNHIWNLHWILLEVKTLTKIDWMHI